ncbi:unnamed protein product, partial [Phaeothamnion confervicola]
LEVDSERSQVALLDIARSPRSTQVTAATPIHEDSQPCCDVADNPFSERRVQHIDIMFHIMRERVESEEVVLVPTPATDQLANLLTKPLPAPRTLFFRSRY